MALEYKSFQIEVKEIDETGTFIGLASPYNNIDDGNDRCLPSVGPINNNKTVPMLWQHDTHSPIGSLLLTDTPAGIQVKGNLALNKDDDGQYMVRKAAEGYALLKNGLLKLSIGYNTLDYEYVTENNQTIRNLISIDIMEVSLVTFPMNSSAVVSSVKNKDIGSGRVKIKGVSGSVKLPLADVKVKWDAKVASKNVLAAYTDDKGNISKDAQNAFFYFDDTKPNDIASYKFGFADIVDDKLTAIPGGIESVASALQDDSLELDADVKKGIVAEVNIYLKKIGVDLIEDTTEEPDKGAKSKNNVIEHKALGFNEIYQMRQNSENRWQAESALDNSLDSIIQDDDMVLVDKTTAINSTIDDFANMYKTIFIGMASAICNCKSTNFKYETKEAFLERKAGKQISKINQDKLQQCKDGIDGILPLLKEMLCCTDDDTTTIDDDNANKDDDNLDDKGKKSANQRKNHNTDTLELKNDELAALEGLSKYFEGDEQ